MISALVLAAGLSRRMGTNKLLLSFPPGERTVLSQVLAVLQDCPLNEIITVTGHEREKIEAMLSRHVSQHGGLRFVYNPDYCAGDMLSSIQVGLAAMSDDCGAALIALGDQPQIERRIVEQVMAAHVRGAVIIPSFNRHGGHPILIDRACWPDILALPLGASLRDVWHAHPGWLRYVQVDTETILRDVDTPDEYRRLVSPDA
jgi:molybdenum cofactor cytidylyltransferase